MTFRILLAAAILAVATQARAEGTAGERLAQCTGDQQAQIDCVGFIIGWQIGYEIFSTTCIPEDASGEELRQAFVTYAEEHSERMDEEDRGVLRDALFARWPCE